MKTIVRVLAVLCLLLAVAAPVRWDAEARPAAPAAGTTELVSVASDGSQGNDSSWLKSSISADGRFVAFHSQASNLVDGDTNGFGDVFVRDRLLGITERVSLANDGSQANWGAGGPSISVDGRYVAFSSSSTNLVNGDTNNQEDVFVRDRLSGTTERVSVASDETQGNSYSDTSSISADGQYVAFHSSASNLVSGDTNDYEDVFVRDRLSGTTERVSVASDETQGNQFSSGPSISAEGRYVAFLSWASNLVGGDTNYDLDIFVRDRLLGTTERVSVASDGTQGNDAAWNRPFISAYGRYIAFDSNATNLVTGDTNGAQDAFIRDRVGRITERVSVANDETQGNDDTWRPSISADGRYAAFVSLASNLVDGDTNGFADVFVRDRLLGITERVSVASDGSQANIGSDSLYPSISADGRYVVYESAASNLVVEDTNNRYDVFVRDRGEPPPVMTVYLPVVIR
jgi:Tol biopolymer transport system component